MSDQHTPGRWTSFVSLNWYDGAIEFLFRFVAKTSEPLLAAGIVYSAADVLSKGHLGSANTTMDNLWAISQALAIESSGGVVLVYGLQSVKEHDHVKAWLYLILSALLAIAGGIMLFMQLAGWENQQTDSSLMLSLFALRCVVSVGYIYLCRTKAISFRNLDHEEATAPIQPAPPVPAQPANPAIPQESAPAQIDYKRLAQELAPLLQAVRTTIIEEVKASIAGPEQNLLLLNTAKTEQPTFRSDERPLPEKLETVYQQLLQRNGGRSISARALAQEVHIHRRVCSEWLKTTHPENIPAGATTTASKVELEPLVITSEVEPEPLAMTSQMEPEPATTTGAVEPKPPVTTSEVEPEPATTTSAVEPEPLTMANQMEPEPSVTTDEVEPELGATASKVEPEPLTMANQMEPEPPVTTDEVEPETVTTTGAVEPEVTATRPQRKATRPRPKATTIRPASQ